jgi:hypothetical protein
VLHVGDDNPVDDELARVRAAVEADVANEDAAQLSRANRTAAVPGTSQLRGGDRRDAGVEWRECDDRAASVLWADRC